MTLRVQAAEASRLGRSTAPHRTRNQARTIRVSPTSELAAHFRKILVVVSSVLCRTWVPFVLVGALNRVFPVFASVFFCYPGNERYERHYIYPSCRKFMLWFPLVIGIFRQGKKWGLICGAPVTESEFTDAKNSISFLRLLRNLQRVKTILGVEKVSFAGILPALLEKKWPDVTSGGHDHTPEVVRRAIREVQSRHFDGRTHDVVLLGGAGRIGRAVHEFLKMDGIDSIVIDPAASASANLSVPGSANILLVDVSRQGAIKRYVDRMSEGTVVLNEVFPEPTSELLTEFRNKNIAVYHIAGVRAAVYPSLPLGYRNALPCCAIHSADIGEPLVRRIS
jgi:hypothetical protein